MKRLFVTSLSIVAISLAVSTSVDARGRTTEAIAQPMTKISKNIPTREYIAVAKVVRTFFD